MRMKRIGIALFFFCILPVMAQGQTPAELAQERLDYLIGTWDSTTEFFDSAGQVTRTDNSVDVVEPFIGDKVLVTTATAANGTVRKTLRFYDRAEARFYEIGVGEAGDVWILSGGLAAYVMTSQTRTARNGRTTRVRFTHTNIQPNSFEAVMEISRDGGDTWTKTNMIQRLVRRSSGS